MHGFGERNRRINILSLLYSKYHFIVGSRNFLELVNARNSCAPIQSPTKLKCMRLKKRKQTEWWVKNTKTIKNQFYLQQMHLEAIIYNLVDLPLINRNEKKIAVKTI